MRTNVTFRHLAEFVPVSDDDRILAVDCVQWFTLLLRQVTDLQIDDDLCQEDWGIVFFVRRNQKKFWIGLSAWDAEGAWLAHFHHGSFAWLQRFSSPGTKELQCLLADVHAVLAKEPMITNIAWYEESEMSKPQPAGFPAPFSGQRTKGMPDSD
jgi:hypothetical protein